MKFFFDFLNCIFLGQSFCTYWFILQSEDKSSNVCAPTNDHLQLQPMDVCEHPVVEKHGTTTPSLPEANQTRDVHDENVVPKKRYF